jgi:hypothetical protein
MRSEKMKSILIRVFIALKNLSKIFDSIVHNPHLQYPNKLPSHQCSIHKTAVANSSQYEDMRRKKMG